MSDIFRVLSDRLRLRIINLLRKQDLSVSELQRCLEVPQPQVSKRLRHLLDRELVTMTKEGNTHRYALIDDDFYSAVWKVVELCVEDDPELESDLSDLES